MPETPLSESCAETDDKAGGVKAECIAVLKGERPDVEGGRVHTPKLIEEAQAARAEIIQNPTARFDLPDEDDGA